MTAPGDQRMGGAIQGTNTLSRFGDLNIRGLVDVEQLQRIQDRIAKATGIALITVDYRGVPVTRASSFIPFCRMLRADPDLRAKCFSCDAHGGLQAAISGKPCVYLCHMGLVDFAVPIMLGELYLGAVMGGQIQVEPEHRARLEPVMASDRSLVVGDEVLNEAFGQAPHVPHDKMLATAEAIFETMSYFVRNEYLRATRKNPSSGLARAPLTPPERIVSLVPSADAAATSLADSMRPALKLALEQDSLPKIVEIISIFLDQIFDENDPRTNQSAITALETVIVEVTQEVSAGLGWELHQGVLRRHAGQSRIENRYEVQCYLEELAFQLHDFMTEHRGKKRRELGDLLNLLERERNGPLMTSNAAATYLSVSASYFSKHFKEATGTSYVTYITLKRVERAKMMLAYTDMKISSIANELGFQPTNYLTRVFRKVTGQSPRQYRYQHRSQCEEMVS